LDLPEKEYRKGIELVSIRQQKELHSLCRKKEKAKKGFDDDVDVKLFQQVSCQLKATNLPHRSIELGQYRENVSD